VEENVRRAGGTVLPAYDPACSLVILDDLTMLVFACADYTPLWLWGQRPSLLHSCFFTLSPTAGHSMCREQRAFKGFTPIIPPHPSSPPTHHPPHPSSPPTHHSPSFSPHPSFPLTPPSIPPHHPSHSQPRPEGHAVREVAVTPPLMARPCHAW
ncbi:unnamed protein product, partial [Closterium sp. NIES-53]